MIRWMRLVSSSWIEEWPRSREFDPAFETGRNWKLLWTGLEFGCMGGCGGANTLMPNNNPVAARHYASRRFRFRRSARRVEYMLFSPKR